METEEESESLCGVGREREARQAATSQASNRNENTPSAVFKTSACGRGKGDMLSKENTKEAGVEVHTWFVLAADWTWRG